MSASKRIIAADIFSLILFGFVVGGSVELLMGLTIPQSLQSRLLSIPVNLVIARPYGVFRDWVLDKGNAEKAGQFHRTLLDILAFIVFQMPVYMAILATTGADIETILASAVGQIGAMVFMARPYGLWMQFCRNRFVPEFRFA
ncbi:L-alanine exporter AlaE [Parendozoicomonas sp. Alg238-R29]|uniref:L-alanine exporter AlaE n=1 Tax=Parendozoicomonas sp. Alg238-R29 TaxID=2993446 RepID=UPI00248F11B3|nr:L-alanine exporter AlaE [Parendozoicomonas sp. Alg238-R29]